MCGIAGKVSAKRPVDAGRVATMCERQVHRGPDSRGLYSTQRAALGIQRLRVIDLETGDQPIYNEDRTVAVVLNGEIYNYLELRADLERRGHRFRTQGDTEVIAHLYEEHGAKLVDHLNGMFAFAVWDERHERLLLARDRVGKKPLFFRADGDELIFASELRALMAGLDGAREIDPSSLDCYLAYGYIPAPWTIWRGVAKLPPAHTLVWQSGATNIDRYWSLDYSRKRTEAAEELEGELRRLIGAAVRRRMIADVPLGAFLSGGVDSSIVVAEMAAASSRPVKTFSIGFEEEEFNELPRARIIAERFSTDHHEFIVEPDAIALAPVLAAQYGEPYADSSAIPTYRLAEATRREVTVALNGDGGDESFAGYLRYVANSATSSIPRSLGTGISTLASRIPEQPGSRSLMARARRLLVPLSQDPIERYTRHVSIFDSQERHTLLNPDVHGSVDPTRAAGVIREPWTSSTAGNTVDCLMDVDVHSYLPEDLLVKVDIASMAHSLEARSPLLDHHVMEFAASLPVRLKVRAGRKKRILRSAYADTIPASVLDGKKMGFGVPLAHWFRHDLRDHSREILMAQEAAIVDYVKPAAVDELLTRHAAGSADNSYRIWALLQLELWHRGLPSTR